MDTMVRSDVAWAQAVVGLADAERAALRAADAKVPFDRIAEEYPQWTPTALSWLVTSGRKRSQEATPDEVIARRALGMVSTDEMLADLAGREYTFGSFVGDPWGDDYEPGTWDQVRSAYQHGRITESEFDVVREAVGVAW